MIINVRGTSGSGKTYLMRELLKQALREPMPIVDDVNSKRRQGHIFTLDGVARDIALIGDYSGPECGGCDKIKTQDEAELLVRNADHAGFNVLFEGLLITHIYTRWANLCKEDPQNFMFAFLDTPLPLCIERVKQRRERNGRAKTPFNPANTEKMYYDMMRVYERCQREGLPYIWVGENGADQVYTLLKERG